MKKLISALIVLTVVLSFATVGSAAMIKSYDLTYKILNSTRQEISDISGLAVGDKFYVDFYMSGYPANQTTFGAELLFDTSCIAYDNNKSSQQVVGQEENDEGEMVDTKFVFSVANRAANDGIALSKIGTDKWNTSEFSFSSSKYFARLRFVVKGECKGKTIDVASWTLSDGMGDGYVPNSDVVVELLPDSGNNEPSVKYEDLTLTEGVAEIVGEAEIADWAYYAAFTNPGASFLKWTKAEGEARAASQTFDLTGTAGTVKVGFVSGEDLDENELGIMVTDSKEAPTTVWCSQAADKAE